MELEKKISLIIGALAVSLLASSPFLMGSYATYMLFLLLIFVGLSSALNYIAGFVGLHSLGNAVFFGIGAYSFALIARGNVLYAVILASILCILCSLVFIPMLGIRGIYFVLSTIFVCEAVRLLVTNLRDLTGGAAGVHVTPPPGYNFSQVYYFALIVALAAVFVGYVIRNSRAGLYLYAIRENEEAAAAIGVNTVKYKFLSLALSSIFTGLVGVVYAYYLLYIDPLTSFSVSWSLMPLFTIIIGGEGTVLGPIFGSITLIFLQEITKPLGEWYLTIFSAMLIIVALFFPEGIIGFITRAFARMRKAQKSNRK